jgi:lysophospholipase L1-like esterase
MGDAGATGAPEHGEDQMNRTSAWLAGVACAALGASTLAAQAADAWIGTWAASPQPIWGADFVLPVGVPRALHDQTIRQIARVSLGGHRVRVTLSNEYGDRPLVIGGASLALAKDDGTLEGAAKPLTFAGAAQVTIPPGAPIVSDPVDLDVLPLGKVAVSLYLPQISPVTTWHFEGVQTATIADGYHLTDSALDAQNTIRSRLFLSEILVDAPADAHALVTFGDSITDGANSTPDANHRWPDILAERLKAAAMPVAVVNEGISGARVLRDRMGDNALARFDRDVLSQPKAEAVVLMMGINDIGWPGSDLSPVGEPAPSAADITAGYRQLSDRAHARGLRIFGATLTPFEGALTNTPIRGYYSPDKEAKRQAVNDFIRHSGVFDGVIDFDAALRDPAHPSSVQAAYDSGDHLHPNDAGYKAMAEAVDLTLLSMAK